MIIHPKRDGETPPAAPIPSCFICKQPLTVRLTRSQRGKIGVLLTCPNDGRHLRAFVNHRPWVEIVVARLEATDEIPKPKA